MPAGSRPHGRRVLSGTVVALLIAVISLVGGTPAHADDVRDLQWQLGFLRAQQAWHESTGEGVTVAVIDSGVDANHPDLRGQVLPGKDFVDGSTDGRTDVVGHGTSVAALIAGRGDDSDGVIGLAYDAKILPIRVLDPENKYDSPDIVALAIRWAVDRGADIINLSLGSADSAAVITEALLYAFDNDVVVIACDGNISNNRGTSIWHPAREPGVVAVSGTKSDGGFWSGSLQGRETVLAAPAFNITGAHPGGDYWNVQGTSFAAPLVAASAALVRSRFPDMTAPNVINRLIRSAWDSGTPGRDPQFGFGIVNPTGALTMDLKSVKQNPLLPAAPSIKPEEDTGGQASPASPGPASAVPTPQAQENQSAGMFDGTLIGVLILICVALLMIAIMAAAALLVVKTRKRPQPAPVGPSPGSPLPPGSPLSPKPSPIGRATVQPPSPRPSIPPGRPSPRPAPPIIRPDIDEPDDLTIDSPQETDGGSEPPTRRLGPWPPVWRRGSPH